MKPVGIGTGEMTASPTLVDLVDLYIGAVPEPVLEVLDLVAIAEPLELTCLTAMTDPTIIEDAERRELIAISESSSNPVVCVAYPLYGEARRASTGQMRAARLRGRIARTMKESASGSTESPDVVRLGLLWLESDLPADPEVYLEAALAAYLRLDLEMTHRLAQAATQAGAGTEALLLYAQSLHRLGRADEAEQVLNTLPEPDVLDVTWLVAIAMRAANLQFTQGEPEKA